MTQYLEYRSIRARNCSWLLLDASGMSKGCRLLWAWSLVIADSSSSVGKASCRVLVPVGEVSLSVWNDRLGTSFSVDIGVLDHGSMASSICEYSGNCKVFNSSSV